MFPTQGVLLKCNKSPGQSVILMQRAGGPSVFFYRPQGKAGGRGKEHRIRVGERMERLCETLSLPGAGALPSTGSWRARTDEALGCQGLVTYNFSFCIFHSASWPPQTT